MLEWPLSVLQPERYSFELAGGLLSGGASLDGSAQVVSYGYGGFWLLRMERVLIASAEQVLALHKFQAALDRGAEPVTFVFPDYGYMVDYLGGAAMTVTATLAASRGATTVRLSVATGQPLVAGFEFSYTDFQGFQRRHRLVQVSTVSAGVYDCKIRPPLRAALGAGAITDFVNPSITMRLVDPSSIYAPLTAGRFGEVSPTFVEHFGNPGSLT